MKRRLRIKPLLCLLMILVSCLCITTLCLAKQDDGVENALNERLTILCDYYGNKITHNEAKDKLALVETGSILEEDIDNLICYMNTDIEPIKGYTITDVDYQCDSWNNYKGTYRVDWTIDGYFGSEKMTAEYSFNAVKYTDMIKLTNIKKI